MLWMAVAIGHRALCDYLYEVEMTPIALLNNIFAVTVLAPKETEDRIIGEDGDGRDLWFHLVFRALEKKDVAQHVKCFVL